MAYLLRFTGAAGYITIPEVLFGANTFKIEMDVTPRTISSNFLQVLSSSAGDNTQRNGFYFFGTTRSHSSWRIGGVLRALDSPVGVYTAGTKYNIVVDYDGAALRLIVNGTTVTTTACSGTLQGNAGIKEIGANSPETSANRAPIDLYRLKFTVNGLLVRDYDPSLSGGSGTVLPDAVNSTNNGTQVGTWPADNSEWVFYSDGGAVTASATYDVGGIGFAISANEVDPAITAAVDYDIGGLSFAVSSTVTTPGVTTSLNYDIGSIGFAASATVGVNASGAYDIGSVGFDVSASATTNNAVASVAYDVGSIGFAVNSSVSSVNTASTSYDIGAIEFAVSSILVTNASGAVNYDIGGVTYSINANAPLNEPERSLSGKDNPFWRKSIFFNTQRRY